mmetsp:Transcript_23155/g.70937  ORF Transcript_23155/g.70937 Transcript_23155/m.70937 type:complete len:324 (-) Transcript_23155:508-1479(-)
MLPLWAMATLGAAPSLVLNDGTRHPLVGYGTYKVGVVPASASSAATGAASPADAANPAECVEAAIGLGYRFIDCAEFYANEKAVGEGIARAGVPRGELYLASKVWTSTIHAGPEAVQAQLAQTLSDLGTSYLDLYCIHWPVPTKHVEAYKQLEKAHKAGLIRSIGVSNYAKEDYQELIDAGITVMPAINQIEINPFLYRKETIAFFESVGCKLQSYRALRDGKAFEDPTVVEIASKLGKTPAQILGRWCVQHGIIAIVKSVKAERMAENLAIFDFEIPPEDMERLDNLTTPDAIAKFVELYRKCVVRDTPLSPELARMEITEM